jgi:hypothetical protein
MGQKSELRDGMMIDGDVPITMDDGLVLRADVYRPPQDGKYPVILTYGPYGKGLAFQEGYPDQWRRLAEQHPDVIEASTNKYQNWEVADPEKWVPDGYVCVRVDSRGAGRERVAAGPNALDPSLLRPQGPASGDIWWEGHPLRRRRPGGLRTPAGHSQRESRETQI